MFNKQLKTKILTLEVVLDALIGVLIHKKVLSRDDIQRQILEQARDDREAQDDQ
jgi:hypothetical protein